MGVTGLWPILTPVMKHRSLSSLKGQTVAVDLSIWVCENQGVRQMQGRVLKPHIRNLFFRVSTLLQHGIRLVFVVEGEAPELKHQTMASRLRTRHKSSVSLDKPKKFGRGKFRVFLRECCELLDCLGIPYIQATGEAESMCAALNAAGLVDACVSDDSDCFLYGAKVVYRNLTLDSKGPQVESYSVSDMTSDLGLTRESLVALALVLGCDYYQAGIPGVGDITAVKLMTSLASFNILERFRQWKHLTPSGCIDDTEVSVWRKASSLPDFPPEKVIEEFMIPKEKVPRELPEWHRPFIIKMLTLCTQYLDWPEQYSLEKVLPLITLWDQQDIMRPSCQQASHHLVPCRIIRKRVKQRVPCFEVEWETPVEGPVDEAQQQKVLITLEQENRFQMCFPALVESFSQQAEQLKAAKPKRGRKPKPKKDLDTLADEMDDLHITTGTMDHKSTAVLSSDHHSAFSSQTSGTHFNHFSDSDDCLIPDISQPSRHPPRNFTKGEEKNRVLFPDILDPLDDVFVSKPEVNCPSVSAAVSPEYPSANVASGSANKAKNRSVVDRRVEYVPLGQRVGDISKGGHEVSECTEVVDLDDSYTYIPLFQRLKARLGSREKQSSMASATSQEAHRSESIYISPADGGKQSQELRLQASTWEEQNSSLLDDDPLQKRDTNDKSAVNNTVQSSFHAANGGEQDACLFDDNSLQLEDTSGLTDIESHIPDVPVRPGSNSTYIPAAGSTCSTSTTLSTITIKADIDLSCIHTKDASVTMVVVTAGQNNSSGAGNSTKFHYETGAVKIPELTLNASGLDEWFSCSHAQQGKKITHEKSCAAHTKTQHPEKRTKSDKKSQKKLAFSQKAKKTVGLSDLLDNWSDSDCAENCDVGSNDSLLDCSISKQKPDKNCFLLENECAQSILPSPLSGLGTQYTDMVTKQTKVTDVSHDALSFVSDGHFTLQHSLFASILDSDIISDISTVDDSSVQQLPPESETSIQFETLEKNESLRTADASDGSFQESCQTETVVQFPGLSGDATAVGIEHAANFKGEANSAYLELDGESFTIHSEASGHLPNLDRDSVLYTSISSKGYTALGVDSTCSGDDRHDEGDDFSQVPGKPKRATSSLVVLPEISEKSIMDQTEPSAVCKSSDDKSSQPANRFDVFEEVSIGNKTHVSGKDSGLDVSFLPLSQRLRLKKPNSKLFKGLDKM